MLSWQNFLLYSTEDCTGRQCVSPSGSDVCVSESNFCDSLFECADESDESDCGL